MPGSRVRPLRAVPDVGCGPDLLLPPDQAPGARSDIPGTRTEGGLRAVIDRLPLMVGYWDADLRNRLANQAYAEYLGLSVEQLCGRPLLEVIGDKAFAINEPYLLAALAGRPQHFDRSTIDASGETRYTTEVHTPDIDPAGFVRGIVVVLTDVTPRVKAEMALAVAKRELESLASTDELTGLASRRVLNERAELALAGLRRALPGARCVGVLLLDLDGLGRLNEEFGKQAGDDVLVEVGRRLNQVARETDVVARMGGDEFVVLMPGLTRPGDATGLAHRIVKLVHEPITLASQPALSVQVSTSLGVAVGISGTPTLSVQGLLREADTLMFQVKKQGGNRWARDPNAHVFEMGAAKNEAAKPAATAPASPPARPIPVPGPVTESEPIPLPGSVPTAQAGTGALDQSSR